MTGFRSKTCANCAKTFQPSGGGAKWCEVCSVAVKERNRLKKNADRLAFNASHSRRSTCNEPGCSNRVNSLTKKSTGKCAWHSHVETNRRAKELKKAAGVCLNCGKGTATGGGRCDTCRKARSEATRGEVNRRNHLRSMFGLTLEEWTDLFVGQGSCCAICSSSEAGGKWGEWHTDHDHDSGKIRGILCAKCNWMIGHANDRPEVLLAAASYLGRHAQSKETA